MRRRRPAYHNHSEAGIPLFPVLTVLLAAVGVLCFLLLVVLRQAMLSARADDRSRTLKIRAAELDRQLQAVLSETDRLCQQEAALHTRLEALANRVRQLERAIRADRQQILRRHNLLAQLDREATQLQKRIGRLTAQLDAAQPPPPSPPQASTAPEMQWKVVLAESPHGASYSPIFLECLDDAVVFQPYGLALSPVDFKPDSHGTSTFQRTVHRLVERMERSAGARAYPVLIVRPAGLHAFYVAADQLARAGIRFGYELVDADQKLTFEQLPGLPAETLQELIAAARAGSGPALPGLAGINLLAGDANGSLGPDQLEKHPVPPGSATPNSPASVSQPPLPAGQSRPSPGSVADRRTAGQGSEPAGGAGPRHRQGALLVAELLPQPRLRVPRVPGAGRSTAMANAGGVRPRRDLLSVAPARTGVWERPVHAFLDDQQVLLPGEPPLGWPPSRSSAEIASYVLWSAMNHARLDRTARMLVLEVRPVLLVHVSPGGVERYWALRFQLARAGVRTVFLPVGAWVAAELRTALGERIPVPHWELPVTEQAVRQRSSGG